jgi:hypothetical protein
VDTARAGRADAVIEGSAALPLVRAAAALRWSRPDLTATLAELALDAAPDAGTWVAAAGWLLHGRAAIGDGRDTASMLLDGLDRWGDAAVELMGGPEGRRLRIELAGPARRIGETAVARALLASTTGAEEADLELRADVLTELARCAVDDAPDTVDAALTAAEEAWRAAASAPGAASVTLLRAAWSRRAGRAAAASAEALDGLATVRVRGRCAGATTSDHVAAALTAEWIAALVDEGRLDEARTDGVAAADLLVGTARPSRQIAGLRLAIARVTAVEESPDAVLAALEPAAQVAADSDVPELESACRSMLGELHETAGRLDAALAALRAAMAADRRDRERAAQLRVRLAAAADAWADRPSRSPADVVSREPVLAPSLDAAAGPRGDGAVDRRHAGSGPAGSGSHGRERSVTTPADEGVAVPPGAAAGRRARRLAAEALEHRINGASTAADAGGPDGDRRTDRGTRRGTAGRAADAGHGSGHARHGAESASGSFRVAGATPPRDTTSAWGTGSPHGPVPAAYRAPNAGSSMIGDALLRELVDGGRTAPDGLLSPSDRSTAAAGRDRTDGDHAETAARTAHDPLFGPLVADGTRGSAAGARRDDPTVRWDRPADRPPSDDDTVVFGTRVNGHADRPARRPRTDDGRPSEDVPGESRPAHDGKNPSAPGTGGRPDGTPPSGTSASVRHGEEDGAPADERAGTSGPSGTANGSGPARRGMSGRAPGRPPSTDTDGLGLADLLAGALAAYRDL